MLVEVARTFGDRSFTRTLRPTLIEVALLSLRVAASLPPITIEVHGVATRPKDDLVLATAVSGKAEYLVTGDRPLQALGQVQGVTILSPRQFLTMLDAEAKRG